MGSNKVVNLVYAISFLDLCAVGMTFPLFSTHLRDLGVSHTVIGILSSTYSGVQVLSGPLIGGWSDVRDRKTVLKYTLLACAIGYALEGITTSIFLLFIIRIILGIVKHTQSICKAVITDLVPRDEHAAVFGRSASVGSLGFIVGPFLGGHLSEVPNGFVYVCELCAVLFCINIVLSSMLPDDSNKSKKKTTNVSIILGAKNEFKKTIRELRTVDWENHWQTFTLKLTFGIAVNCFFINQGMYLREKYNLSQKHIGYFISFFSTIGMITGFFFNKINVWYKNDDSCYTRLLHFSSLLTLCFFIISLSFSIWTILLVQIPFSLSFTAIRVVTMELMMKDSEMLHNGSLSGASNSIMSVSRLVAPILTGIVGDVFGEENVMFVGVIPSVIGVGICFYMKRNIAQLNKKNK